MVLYTVLKVGTVTAATKALNRCPFTTFRREEEKKARSSGPGAFDGEASALFGRALAAVRQGPGSYGLGRVDVLAAKIGLGVRGMDLFTCCSQRGEGGMSQLKRKQSAFHTDMVLASYSRARGRDANAPAAFVVA